MVTIKILGSGCPNCKRLETVTREALYKLGIEALVLKVTEYPEIMNYRIMSTPGLVINERVVSSGRIPTEAEITTYLVDARQKA